ncbi:hypothetical protein BDZ91DRAFT_785054 [Kalaharituber pfeilii]|nr:hypothetical protein BDZ91DRAFT_785054 [Kalaharituber pfeilii]
MPPRKRAASSVYKDTEPNTGEDVASAPATKRQRQRRSVLGEKHNLNVAVSTAESEGLKIKQGPEGQVSSLKRSSTTKTADKGTKPSSQDDVLPPPAKRRTRCTLGEKENADANVNTTGSTDVQGSRKKRATKKAQGTGPKPQYKDNKAEVSGKDTASNVDGSETQHAISEHTESVSPKSQSIGDQVIALLSLLQPPKKCSISPGASADEIGEALTKDDLWSPALLELFRESAVTSLSLSKFRSDIYNSFSPPLLSVFFKQDTFIQLEVLDFTNLPLGQDDIALLRLLPKLRDLNLSNTGIDNHALHHLVCHRHTLQRLHIGSNPSITDDARVPLAALTSLTHLYLDGTSFSLPSLRWLVIEFQSRPFPHPTEDDPLPGRIFCRLCSIPAPCLDYLNRTAGNAISIPNEHPYISNPEDVANLQVPALKKNLELHAVRDKSISISGSKLELMYRLKEILETRINDQRLRRAMIGPEEAGGRVE